MIVDLLDVESILSLLRTSTVLHSLLSPCDSLWKMLCIKTELANYSCLETQPGTRQLGWAGSELHNTGVSDKANTGRLVVSYCAVPPQGVCHSVIFVEFRL